MLVAAECLAANVLRNPEFRGDNLGGLLNWSLSGVADVRSGRDGGGFDNPRDGWVYVGFVDPQVRGEVSLDGARIVTPRDDESCDTLRFVAAGRHVVKVELVSAEAARTPLPQTVTMVVHAVKLNFMAAGGDLSEASTIDRFQYGLVFRRRYFFNRFARYDDFNWTRKNAEQRRWSDIYEAHGAVYGGEARLGADAANWGRPDKLLAVITNSAPYRNGLPVSLDESSPVATRLNHATLADARWSSADAATISSSSRGARSVRTGSSRRWRG